MRPWAVLDRVEVDDGVLELRRRDADDFVIALDDLILMASRPSGSEAQLGMRVAEQLRTHRAPRLLVSGLGMGITLHAALRVLPPRAVVDVVELNPVVIEWCRGPLATLCADALGDRRVRVSVGDVAEAIRTVATGPPSERLDGIALDLYEGVRPSAIHTDDPFYGARALRRAHTALRSGGVFGRWYEQADPAFERRLRAAGFEVHAERAGARGRRHAICLGIARPTKHAC